MDIENLKPGPELDDLIHGKLMKTPIDYDLSITISKKELESILSKNENHSRCLCNLRESCDICRSVIATSTPKYSTDISAAWPVVEKMKSQGVLISLTHCNGSYVAFDHVDGDIDSGKFCEFSNTAPHAICLAALKAMEIKS